MGAWGKGNSALGGKFTEVDETEFFDKFNEVFQDWQKALRNVKGGGSDD